MQWGDKWSIYHLHQHNALLTDAVQDPGMTGSYLATLIPSKQLLTSETTVRLTSIRQTLQACYMYHESELPSHHRIGPALMIQGRRRLGQVSPPHLHETPILLITTSSPYCPWKAQSQPNSLYLKFLLFVYIQSSLDPFPSSLWPFPMTHGHSLASTFLPTHFGCISR